jgi:hypothetical protein
MRVEHIVYIGEHIPNVQIPLLHGSIYSGGSHRGEATDDLSEEDIVGDVFGFEDVATDGAAAAAQVSWFPG